MFKFHPFLAVAVSRECTKDCVIKGLPIKKGTSVIILAYSVHRDPQYFPDPEKFDPERFSAEAKQSRDPYTYLPFGHGPRNCIGLRFAQMEMKLALVHIFKRFSLVVAPETKIPPVLKIKSILGCADGIHLRVKRRE
jgi:cytochrome P450 family 3 subfamily A